jgi:DNA-binding SARP family transcriptional activator/tetratricopeptide (TPR) repeat protein
MLLRLLGPIEAADESAALRVPGLRCKTLLTLLALQPGTMISTDRLVDEIWGAMPPPTATNSLANAVMRVRKVVGPDRIMTGQGSYGLAESDVEIDLSRFEALVTEAPRHQPEQQMAFLDKALRLWRGELFGGAQSTPMIDDERVRVEGLRHDAQLSLCETKLALHQPVKPAAVRPLVETQPGNERAWASLGLAIHRNGDAGLALETIRLATDSLLERGLHPSSVLTDAEQEILSGPPPPDAVAVTSPGQGAAVPGGRANSSGATTSAGARSGPGSGSRSGPGARIGVGVGARPETTESGAIGRDEEIQAIMSKIAAAATGTATLMLVVGEAGIGKSTLVREQLPAAADPDLRWIVSQCTSGGRGPTIELSLELGVDVEQAWSGEVLPLIVERLRAVSMERPTVVVIEDIHTTLGVNTLVSELVSGVKGHRVAVVVTGRPGRNTDLVRESLRGAAQTVIDLEGLRPAEVTKLIGHIEPEQVDRLMAETGGNPLYLSTGAQLSTGRSDLSNYVMSEVSRLSPQSRRIVELLSLHELPMTLGSIGSAAAINDGLADHLQPLFESGLVVERNERTVQVQVRHQLIAETIVASLSESQILELHRAARDAIVGAGTNDPATLFLAAHHGWKAGRSGDPADASVAAGLCESAGDAAHAHGEWAQAADFYRRALDGGAIDDEHRSGRCRLGHAVALFKLGSTDATGAFLDAARDASVRVDGPLLADVALEWDRGTFSQAMQVNEERIRIVKRALRGSDIDASRRARLLAGHASELTFSERSQERFDIAEEAMNLARSCDLQTQAFVLSHRQLTIAALDTTEERVKAADAFLQVATELRDPHLLFQANFQRTGPAAIAGDLALLDDLLDEADDFAQHLSVRLYQWLVCHSKSALRLLQGDIDAASRLSHQAFALARGSHQHGEAMLIFGEQSCQIARITGSLPDLVPGLTQMPGGPQDGYTVAALLAMAGEVEQAEAVLPDDDANTVSSLPKNFMERPTLQNLAVLADALNRPSLGKAVAEQLERHPLELGITGVAHPCGHHFAALALRPTGDWGRVLAHHAAAVEIHEQAHHPLLSIEAKREFAKSLTAADVASHRSATAAELTAEVNTEASRLNAAGFAME